MIVDNSLSTWLWSNWLAVRVFCASHTIAFTYTHDVINEIQRLLRNFKSDFTSENTPASVYYAEPFCAVLNSKTSSERMINTKKIVIIETVKIDLAILRGQWSSPHFLHSFLSFNALISTKANARPHSTSSTANISAACFIDSKIRLIYYKRSRKRGKALEISSYPRSLIIKSFALFSPPLHSLVHKLYTTEQQQLTKSAKKAVCWGVSS